MEKLEINIYPVAYICVNDDGLLDDIQNNLCCVADGDGQALLSVEELTAGVEETDSCDLKETLENVLVKLTGHSGDVWFYAR